MEMIEAPFSDEQVQALNEYQVGAIVDWPMASGHPFTCASRGDGQHSREGGDLGLLIATSAGWICPACGYTQDWAHEGMASAATLGQQRDFDIGRTSAWSTAWLHTKLAGYIKAYGNLYANPRYWQDARRPAEENRQAEHLRTAIETMLASLHRAAMVLEGVETRPGRARAISATWTPAKAALPMPGKPIDILMQDGPEVGWPHHVSNPLHDGFGTDVWVRRGRQYEPQFGAGLVLPVETGRVTHWRATPPGPEPLA